MSTLIRQWLILGMIPRSPKWIATSQIHSQIALTEYEADIRTVQRDLISLSGMNTFPLVSKKDGTAQYWAWMENTEVLSIPGIDSNTAVTFSLAEQYLSQLLPLNTVAHLQPYFKAARKILNKTPDGLGSWQNKVRIVPQGQALIPPTTQPEVINVIYEALLYNKQFTAEYMPRVKSRDMPRNKPRDMPRDKPREKDKSKSYVINPLGLVFRNNTNYLLATNDDTGQVKQFSLHRFLSATLNDLRRQMPAGYDIDDYINNGSFDYGAHNKDIILEVVFNETTAMHLEESPLAIEQKITTMKNGHKRIVAKVKDTAQLRWWLFGFADQVEVIKPVGLRQEMKQRILAMAKKYQ